jgi:hypothetical protein
MDLHQRLRGQRVENWALQNLVKRGSCRPTVLETDVPDAGVSDGR